MKIAGFAVATGVLCLGATLGSRGTDYISDAATLRASNEIQSQTPYGVPTATWTLKLSSETSQMVPLRYIQTGESPFPVFEIHAIGVGVSQDPAYKGKRYAAVEFIVNKEDNIQSNTAQVLYQGDSVLIPVGANRAALVTLSDVSYDGDTPIATFVVEGVNTIETNKIVDLNKEEAANKDDSKGNCLIYGGVLCIMGISVCRRTIERR